MINKAKIKEEYSKSIDGDIYKQIQRCKNGEIDMDKMHGNITGILVNRIVELHVTIIELQDKLSGLDVFGSH